MRVLVQEVQTILSDCLLCKDIAPVSEYEYYIQLIKWPLSCVHALV